jgi:hypothetical protein
MGYIAANGSIANDELESIKKGAVMRNLKSCPVFASRGCGRPVTHVRIAGLWGEIRNLDIPNMKQEC